MDILPQLFENNRRWAEGITRNQPGFFQALARQQSPAYLWIGCSDSRVPANEIVGLLPGELFVHRNVANLVHHSDMNCLSVLQYAIDTLKVKHIIVCGHYGCGGVQAAIQYASHGLIDNWLRPIRETHRRNEVALKAIKDERQRLDRLCELSTVQQAVNVANTTVVQDAWKRGQPVVVHRWIYGIADGLLKDLGPSLSSPDDLVKLEDGA
jgi:carbonic anhydrase